MTYRQPKGPGTIHGWTTRPVDRDGRVFGARIIFWAALVCVLYALGDIRANAGEMKVRPFIMYQHQSDLLRGPPLFRSRYEPTNDFAALGATFEWPRVELDVAHGVKSIDCAYLIAHAPCKWESGSQVTVRYYVLTRP